MKKTVEEATAKRFAADPGATLAKFPIQPELQPRSKNPDCVDCDNNEAKVVLNGF